MKDYIAANEHAYNALAAQYKQRLEEYVESDAPLLAPFINGLIARFAHPRVLELGPGSGLALRIFEEAGLQTTAIELAQEIVSVAGETSPNTTFIHGDFLDHDFDAMSFQGIFAKAFIHLFPKNDAIQVLEKVHSLTTRNGLFFISTTVHAEPSEGYERKSDYANSPKRFRKKWTERELLEALNLGQKWQVVDKNYNEERNKNWLALTLQKIS